LYLTEAFPPDEAWLREWALFHHIDLNPGPPHRVSGDLGISDAEAITQGRDIDWVQINGGTYAVWRSLRSNYCFWDLNVAHEADMREAAATWERLTGERWEGYQWKPGHLKP
jgi:hypothetical protein